MNRRFDLRFGSNVRKRFDVKSHLYQILQVSSLILFEPPFYGHFTRLTPISNYRSRTTI
jgi:hypothetical protein